MSRRLRPMLALPCAALALAGCGSSPDAGDRASAEAPPSAERIVSPLRVGATEARLGDATVATDSSRLRELSGGERVDPRKIKRRAKRREGVGAGASCTDAELVPDPSNLTAVQASTLCLLNGERADRGLTPLAENVKLAQAASSHSQDMVSKGYFEHTSQDGRDVIDRVRGTGYIGSDVAWTVGENLAWGTGTLATPRGIVNAWMNSEGHKANILRETYREIGFGIVLGNPRSSNGQGATYTTNFGYVAGGDAQTVAAPGESAEASGTKTASKRKATKRKKARKSRRARRARSSRARRAAAARRRAATSVLR